MSDAAFSARVGRIRTGKTWTPDGVLKPKFRGRRRRPLPLVHRPSFRFAAIGAVAILCAGAAVDPTALPPQVQAVLNVEALSEMASGLETRARVAISAL